MQNKDYTFLDSITIAEIKEEIYHTKKRMSECIKNKDIKGALKQYKAYLTLNKIFNNKRSRVSRKK